MKILNAIISIKHPEDAELFDGTVLMQAPDFILFKRQEGRKSIITKFDLNKVVYVGEVDEDAEGEEQESYILVAPKPITPATRLRSETQEGTCTVHVNASGSVTVEDEDGNVYTIFNNLWAIENVEDRRTATPLEVDLTPIDEDLVEYDEEDLDHFEQDDDDTVFPDEVDEEVDEEVADDADDDADADTDGDEEEEEEEDEEVEPEKPAKRGRKARVQEDDEPAPVKRRGRKARVQPDEVAQASADESDEEGNDEDEEVEQPVKRGRKPSVQGPSGKKRVKKPLGADEFAVESGDEEDEEEPSPVAGRKKAAQPAPAQQPELDADDDNDGWGDDD